MKSDLGRAVRARHDATPHLADTVQPGRLSRGFTEFASHIAHASGQPSTFVLSCAIILIWAVTGPIFHYSDTWQLIINTGTTIITFLMVFLIQNTQNRDGAAVQAKLDELIRAHDEARNTYMGIEKLPEEQLTKLREQCADDTPSVGGEAPVVREGK
jgi:low affinity Fe/Cu permease